MAVLANRLCSRPQFNICDVLTSYTLQATGNLQLLLSEENTNSALLDIVQRMELSGMQLRQTNLPKPRAGRASHQQPLLIQRELAYDRQEEAAFFADNIIKCNAEQKAAVDQVLAALSTPWQV